ncbi:Uma2 family endonuclease [Saccharopolyspora indica]|uniref:Uma2 family endonuclease n=1 Tax=Saccharopolyspora indica TaxID=1229659 RepID=UPI0022EA37A8|nr:Uma2 family endonuclease [Saccharopolyspora indica]MDA3648325.1 Uma2 family endonuclease [Saccharopolyspora indica]
MSERNVLTWEDVNCQSGWLLWVRTSITKGDEMDSFLQAEFQRAWEGLCVPEGWRAELISGRIEMRPPTAEMPAILDRIAASLVPSASVDWVLLRDTHVEIPGWRGIYQPNLVVVSRDSVPARGARIPGAKALLVVEVVTSNSEPGRTKLREYARAGVGMCLLVDRFQEDRPPVQLFTGPAERSYTRWRGWEFGEPVEIPEPFDLTLDTKGF